MKCFRELKLANNLLVGEEQFFMFVGLGDPIFITHIIMYDLFVRRIFIETQRLGFALNYNFNKSYFSYSKISNPVPKLCCLVELIKWDI